MSKKYSIWDGSTVLITGGTGSFGVFVNKKVLQKGVKKVSTFNTQ